MFFNVQKIFLSYVFVILWGLSHAYAEDGNLQYRYPIVRGDKSALISAEPSQFYVQLSPDYALPEYPSIAELQGNKNTWSSQDFRFHFNRMDQDSWNKMFRSFESSLVLSAEREDGKSFSDILTLFYYATEEYNRTNPANGFWPIQLAVSESNIARVLRIVAFYILVSKAMVFYNSDEATAQGRIFLTLLSTFGFWAFFEHFGLGKIVHEHLQERWNRNRMNKILKPIFEKLKLEGIPTPPLYFSENDQLAWFSSWFNDSPKWTKDDSPAVEKLLGESLLVQAAHKLETLIQSGNLPVSAAEEVTTVLAELKLSRDDIHSTLDRAAQKLEAINAIARFSTEFAISPKAIVQVSPRNAMISARPQSFADRCSRAIQSFVHGETVPTNNMGPR